MADKPKPINLDPFQILKEIHFPGATWGLLRVKWDVSAGDDLDTRTQMMVPSESDIVGWNRKDSTRYLRWAGDETGNGNEAIVVNLKKLREENPSLERYELAFRAFWFDDKRSGAITLEWSTYPGGGKWTDTGMDYVYSKPKQEGSDWQLSANVSAERGTATDHPGEEVYTLSINRKNGKVGEDPPPDDAP